MNSLRPFTKNKKFSLLQEKKYDILSHYDLYIKERGFSHG
jgi:hypothetical protein